MHVRTEAQEIKEPNYFQHLVYLRHWRQVARKIMHILPGNLFELNRALLFQLRPKLSIRHCYAIEWPTASCSGLTQWVLSPKYNSDSKTC